MVSLFEFATRKLKNRSKITTSEEKKKLPTKSKSPSLELETFLPELEALNKLKVQRKS